MENNELKWSSPKAITMLIIVLGIIAVCIVSILRDRIVNQQYRQINVTGQGKVSYVPNLAIVTLGVQIDKAKAANVALDQLNEKMTKIIAAVKAEKVDDQDISTSNYSLNPQYDINKDNISVVTGYSANESLVVKIKEYDKNPEKLSKVISVATKAGANQVNGLAFDATNMDDIKQQARLMAITDAGKKADAMSKAAGVNLDKIMSWYENPVQVPVPYYAYGGADGKGGGGSPYYPQTPTGLKEIIIEMNVSYSLK